jgi:hypothetical protein
MLKTTCLLCRRVIYVCGNVSEEPSASVFGKGERESAKMVHVWGREAGL